MTRHAWPGNVRELQHIIGQALLLEDSRVLDGAHFRPSPPGKQHAISTPTENKSVSRRETAERALRAAHGNKSAAAASLGVTRKTLYAWLKE
jgi:two-component system, NtrC family, response regulator HydG